MLFPSHDRAGELIKHIFSYVNDEEPHTDDLIIKLAFTPIKQQLKRDLEKFEKAIEQRREAGRKSAEARKAKRDERPLTTVESRSTKSTVNVNDNVNVNVNDKVKEKDTIKPEKEFSDEINKFYYNIIWQFPENAHPKNWKAVDKWKDCIRLIVEKDGYDLNSLEHIIKIYRADEFWKGNFQSILKLRQKNKDGVLWIDYFFNQAKNKIENSKQGRVQKMKDDFTKVVDDMFRDQ